MTAGSPIRRSRIPGTRATAALLVAAAAALAACSDSGTGPKRGTGERVTVTPREARLDVGATMALSVTVTNADGSPNTGVRVFWSSEDTALAEVSAEGVVRAKAPGTVRIAASASGTSDVVTVIVTPPAVASVSISPSSASLTVGGSVQLQAAILGANGQPLSGRALSWRSSDEAVAKVDASGRVTGIAPGAAVITATSESRSTSAAVTVVAIPVAGVRVTPASASLVVGQTTQLAATATDASGTPLRDRPVTWTSSNEDVATVSSSGLVIARAPGSATITASVDGKSAAATISVASVPVESVIVSPSPAQLTPGQSVQLEVRVTDASGRLVTDRPISFSSDDPGVATVSGGGLVAGVAPGTTTVRATSDGKTGTTTVMVGAVPVGSVSVSPGSAELIVGGSTPLSAVVRDASGNTLGDRAVSWSSSNGSVATVSSSGVVSAVGVGSAIVFATAEGKTGQSQIAVSPVPVASVSVAPPTSSIAIGQTVQLTATVRDANGNPLDGRGVSWSSADPRIALVSGSGAVVGVSPGTVNVTATSGGKSGSAAVTVQSPAPAPVASVRVSPGDAEVNEGKNVTFGATCLDASGNTLAGRTITWESSDRRLATIEATTETTATVRGRREGTVSIIATCEGTSGSATLRVH